MRATLCAAGIVLAMVSSPAYAQSESGPYVGLSAGVALPQKSENRGNFTTGVPATADFPAIPDGTALGWRTRFEIGFNLGGQLGYRFDNGLRTEIEIAYSQFDVRRHENLAVGGAVIDGVDSAVLTRGPASAANPTVGAVLSTDPGKIKNIGAFGNVLYDFNRAGSLQPYVGAGFGVQRVDIDYRPSNVPVADDNKTKLAYQLMAGATYKLSPKLDLFAQYAYRATTKRAKVALDLLPAELGVQSRQSTVSAGLRFHF